MKLVFMGTPDFAVPVLTALHDAGHEIVGVFTQPDKPRGRHQELTPPEVKVEAMRLGLPVYQPKSVKTEEALELVKSLEPDVAVVVAYGKILPEALLKAPKYGCINIHGSILPKYRGSAPIQWAVINGETKTGVTAMQMDAGVDTGDMLFVDETEIGENETASELYDRLSAMGASLAVKTLEAVEKGELKPEGQDHSLSTHAPMLDKSMCPLDFTMEAQALHNKIRGLAVWPVATAQLDGQTMKIHSSLCRKEMTHNGKEGEIISVSPLLVCCGNGTVLEICELQAQGGKRMKAPDYFRGHPLKENSSFR